MQKTIELVRRLQILPLGWAMGVILIVTAMAGSAMAQYPALSEYQMTRDAEIALAKSAAPANVSSRATIKVLTPSGYQVAREGEIGCVCLVLRGWTEQNYTPALVHDIVSY